MQYMYEKGQKIFAIMDLDLAGFEWHCYQIWKIQHIQCLYHSMNNRTDRTEHHMTPKQTSRNTPQS